MSTLLKSQQTGRDRCDRQGTAWRPFVRGLATTLTLALAFAVPAVSAQQIYTKGVVAADHPLASKAGAEILAQGGNAVDAAVATSFALSVVRPMSCGLGGGGFMVIHLVDDPRTKTPGDALDIALDYRETSPAAITEDYFDKLIDPEVSKFSGAAVAVPTTVEGLLAAQERFGALELDAVMAPAIRLAEDGYVPDKFERDAIDELAEWTEVWPVRMTTHLAAHQTFVELRPGVDQGVRMNPDQAQALRLIASQGVEAVRTGPVADAIIRTVRQAGGVMTYADLATDRLRWTEPLRFSFHGFTILSMPLSSSGGIVMAETLGVVERYEQSHGVDLASMGHNTAESTHLIVEALKHAFADRSRWLGDMPMDDPRITRLLDPARLDTIAARIQPDAIQRNRTYGLQLDESAPAGRLPDDSGTSHVSVVDAQGNAVALTETINLSFGSRILVQEFGFCLNNEMDDFTTHHGAANAFGLHQSDANRPAPGKKPLSSMSPTIVLDPEGDVEVVAGASGGPRIITGTLQAMLNVIVWGMDAQRAVSEPRYHHQWRPNALAFEEALNAQLIQPGERSPTGMQALMGRASALQALRLGLKKKGHSIGSIKSVGNVQLIRRAEEGAGYQAASDPRKGGAPAGPG